MRVVVNRCYGGFGLSNKAQYEYLSRKLGKDNVFAYRYDEKDSYFKISIEEFLNTKDLYVWLTTKDYGESFNEKGANYDAFFEFKSDEISYRSDPILVNVVSELGDEANGDFSDLKLINVPKDANIYISEYDGYETIEEHHRSW